MPNSKTLAILLIDDFADWEYPLLAASARQWFGIETRFFTPSRKAVTSMAGLRFSDGEPIASIDLNEGDAIAIIGSDGWTDGSAPDIAADLQLWAAKNIVVGGICAGTLPLAKAGIFQKHRHTSNGADWITQNAGAYHGADLYQDRPHAIRDGNVVSAPGSAPGTFAIEMLAALLPDQALQISEMKKMFAAEYHQGSSK